MEDQIKQKAKEVAFRIIYALIIKDYRSKDLSDERVFNPSTFLLRGDKTSHITKYKSASLLLVELIEDGYLEKITSQDYYKTYLKITQKFCDELQSMVGLKIELPLISMIVEKKNRKILMNKAQKRNLIAKEIGIAPKPIPKVVRDQIEKKLGNTEHMDVFGIDEMKNKIRKKESNGEIAIKKNSGMGKQKSLLNLEKLREIRELD